MNKLMIVLWCLTGIVGLVGLFYHEYGQILTVAVSAIMIWASARARRADERYAREREQEMNGGVITKH